MWRCCRSRAARPGFVAAAHEQRFRGQRGGLHEAETSTYLARLTQ